MVLNTSCSKAIVDNMLGTHVPKCALHVPNTPKLSLSQNDKKGCNLGFPKLVQNKGLFPLHAVSSKTMVDLDNLVLQSQQQPMESKTINVKFQLQYKCNFGEQFLVVGNDPMLGSWNPSNAIPMAWSKEHVWTAEMGLPVGKFQFKMILKRGEGDIVWQPGPDRNLHTWEAMNRTIVCEDWDNAEKQKVSEDDEVPNTKEPQIESEMPNFVENSGHPEEKLKAKVAKVKSTC